MTDKTRKYIMAKGLLTIFENLNIIPLVFNIDKENVSDDCTLNLCFETNGLKQAETLWGDICSELITFCYEENLCIDASEMTYGDEKNGFANWARITLSHKETEE